jgi:hypothetical protein
VIRRKSELIQTIICIVVLFVVPLVLSAPAVKKGDLPMDMGALTTLTPWQEARPDGIVSQDANTHSPLIERYYPWYAFINHAGAAGDLPLWNPYESFGTPFLALWRTRALSPFSLPVYVLPLHTGIGISIFLKLLIAGLCAYYAARRFHFPPSYALLPALTFQMSGILLVGHWHPASDVLPWFPLLLPCLQRMLLGDYRVWPSVAVLIGLMTLGGDPESVAVILLFLFLLTIIYGLRTYTLRHLTGALITLFIAMALGLMLAAIQLAPYIEFLQQGSLQNRTPASFQLSDIAMMLAPVFSTNTMSAASLLPSAVIGFLLVPLWLAVRPAANRIRKRRLESFLLTTLVLGCLSVFVPLFRAIPGLSHFSFWHFTLSVPLAFGLLAAAAADEWVHLDVDKCKIALKKLIWVLPVFWGMAFLLTLMVAKGLTASGQIPASFILTAGAALLLLALLLTTAFWPKEKLLIFSLSFITAALSWFIYTPTAFVTPNDQIFPETHFIHTLHGLNSRVAGSVRLLDWPLSPHGIAQTYSPAGVNLTRCELFMQQAEGRPQLLRLSGANALLLTKQDIQERYSSLRPMLNIQEVFPSGAILLKDLEAMNRVYVTHTGRTCGGDDTPIIRASGPPLLEGGVLPETLPDSASGTAVIAHEKSNALQITATSSRPGVLVVSDSWYPGWQATSDGKSADVFPVDIAFRGIEISEGNHEITMQYAPFSLQLGSYISLAAMIAVLLGFGSWYRGRKRQ